jgi:hypothetical protein
MSDTFATSSACHRSTDVSHCPVLARPARRRNVRNVHIMNILQSWTDSCCQNEQQPSATHAMPTSSVFTETHEKACSCCTTRNSGTAKLHTGGARAPSVLAAPPSRIPPSLILVKGAVCTGIAPRYIPRASPLIQQTTCEAQAPWPAAMPCSTLLPAARQGHIPPTRRPLH